MKSASRVEKLLIISKLKEADSLEAAAALDEIIKSTPADVDPKEDLRGHAVGALINMTHDSAWQTIKRLAVSQDVKTRTQVAIGLGYSKAEGAGDLLDTLAQDTSPEVREAAKTAAAKLAARK